MVRNTPADLQLPWSRVLTLLRSAKGWSQKDLAAAAGLSSNLISDYECGRKRLRPQKLRHLVGTLGCGPDAIDRALAFLEQIECLAEPTSEARCMARQRQDCAAPAMAEDDGRVMTAVRQLRLLRGWNQKQLAAAAGVGASSVSHYERGTKVPSGKTLAKLAAGAGVPLPLLSQVLGVVFSAQAAVDRGKPGDPAHAAAWIEVIPCIAGERQGARQLWSQLAGRTAAERRSRLEGDRALQSWAFCELACEMSVKAAGDSARQSLDLAKLALRAAQLCAGEERWRLRLQGYAWGHLANSYRVGGDLAAAGDAMERAKRLWRHGSPWRGPLDERVIGSLEVGLLTYQRRLPAALALADRLLAATDVHNQARLLASKAFALYFNRDYRSCMTLLRQAIRLEKPGDDPRMFCVVQHNLGAALCSLGLYRQAESAVAVARAGWVKLGNELDLLRTGWLEAEIAAGLGRTEAAIEGLAQVREGFLARNIEYHSAVAGLALSSLLLRKGRVAECREIAHVSLKVFHGFGIRSEADKASRLLRIAAGQAAARRPHS